MTTIRQQDLIQSVADALQFISYYHPQDYIEALGAAYRAEESPAAKDAIAQILTNSRMCAEGHRPICQDTGIVVAFVKVGMDVKWEGVTMSPADMVNEGVRLRLHGSGQPPARLDRRRPGGRPQEYARQHAGGHPFRSRPGQHRGSEDRGQGRRIGEQVEIRHAESVRLDRRLGVEDRADDGRRAGVRPACWASASAARRKRRWCWPRKR